MNEIATQKLTNRQKEFARFYVEGIYSNAECARKSGYAEKSCYSIASHLLSGKKFPQVLEYIQELQQEKERRYGVTLIGQLKDCPNFQKVLKRRDNSLHQLMLKGYDLLLVV